MKRANHVVGIAIGMAIALAAGTDARAQTVLLQDNFDSYADQAAFQAVWPVAPTATGLLSTTQAFSPIQSIQLQTTAARNARSFTETVASPTDFIHFSIQFFDSNGGAAAYRQYSEMIDGPGTGTAQIVALGLNNNIASTFYMARMTSVDGGSGASAFFQLNNVGAPNRTTGWHQLEAVVMPTAVDFYVDGFLSKTVALPAAGQLRSYDTVRLGSNLSSTQIAYVDDVSVVIAPVPEPASVLAICSVGAVVVSTVRKRWRRKIA